MQFIGRYYLITERQMVIDYDEYDFERDYWHEWHTSLEWMPPAPDDDGKDLEPPF